MGTGVRGVAERFTGHFLEETDPEEAVHHVGVGSAADDEIFGDDLDVAGCDFFDDSDLSEHVAAHGLDFEAVCFGVGATFGENDLGLGGSHFCGGLSLGDCGDFCGFGLGEGAEFDRFGFAGRLEDGG